MSLRALQAGCLLCAKLDMDTLIFGSDQRQGTGLLNELIDAFHPTLAVAACHEFAQATDDLSRAQSLIARLVHGIAEQARAGQESDRHREGREIIGKRLTPDKKPMLEGT